MTDRDFKELLLRTRSKRSDMVMEITRNGWGDDIPDDGFGRVHHQGGGNAVTSERITPAEVRNLWKFPNPIDQRYFDRLATQMEADAAKRNTLANKVERLRKLVLAVSAGEFSGISCGDVEGKNWFDMRDEEDTP